MGGGPSSGYPCLPSPVTMINSPESMSFLFSGSLSRFLVLMAEISGRCSIPTTFPPGCTILARTYFMSLFRVAGGAGFTAVKYPDPHPTSRTFAPGFAYSSNAVAAFACICGAEISCQLTSPIIRSTVCPRPIL